ncbi:death domain-containing protein [Trichonephila clavata]|uniref:Death domain-containing protein n=1 Tax=Trichonephila clavata TaxID=2740835 RepID=A0A8X6GYJ8_TRICU|nr:death domain-containing protein [Trichonephila clavata]
MCFTCSYMECLQRYSVLKSKIVQEAASSHFSLEAIKEHYAADINSKRALSRAKSLDALLYLLEERDILNCRKVSCLVKLSKLLPNTNIGKVVHYYQKLYLEGTDNDSCLCGLEYPYQPEVSALREQEQNQSPVSNSNQIGDDLKEAFKNISLRIGKEWPVLARALDIEECYIDHIISKYPNDKVKQAYEALLLWQKKEKENATIPLLDKALDARHCERKGISSRIRQRCILLSDQGF